MATDLHIADVGRGADQEQRVLVDTGILHIKQLRAPDKPQQRELREYIDKTTRSIQPSTGDQGNPAHPGWRALHSARLLCLQDPSQHITACRLLDTSQRMRGCVQLFTASRRPTASAVMGVTYSLLT